MHWSAVGDPRARDRVLMEWARSNNHVLFTHDLDFGTLLALTKADGPSVIQARTHDVIPQYLGPLVVRAIRQHDTLLEAGALVTIDEARARVRILPIGPRRQ